MKRHLRTATSKKVAAEVSAEAWLPVSVFREPCMSGPAPPSVEGCLLLSTESLSVDELYFGLSVFWKKWPKTPKFLILPDFLDEGRLHLFGV